MQTTTSERDKCCLVLRKLCEIAGCGEDCVEDYFFLVHPQEWVERRACVEAVGDLPLEKCESWCVWWVGL